MVPSRSIDLRESVAVRVALDEYVYGDEAVSGSMALSSRCDGTNARARGLSSPRSGYLTALLRAADMSDC